MKEAPMTEGVKMIYDALDNLAKPVNNGWTEKLNRLEKANKGLRQQCREWKKKALTNKKALVMACIVINQETDAEAYVGCTKAALTEDRECRCGTDCDTCISEYIVELVEGQERIDTRKNNEAVRSEVEGRERMDVEDQKEATLESLDDIVRKAEGLGRELEEKMRR